MEQPFCGHGVKMHDSDEAPPLYRRRKAGHNQPVFFCWPLFV